MSTTTTQEKSGFGFDSKDERFSNLSENESILEKPKSGSTESIPPILEVFNLDKKLGSGSFSTVYLGSLKKDPSQKYALKHIVATNHPSRTINELNFLKQFGGRGSIIGMTTCIRHEDIVVLVMPLFLHHKFQTYACNMTRLEMHTYMRNLFECLSILHSEGIVHRDVKPSNFLYNRDLNKFALIDFGLSQRLPQNNKPTDGWRRNLSSSSITPMPSKPLSTNHNTNLLNQSPSDPPHNPCQCCNKPKVCRICLSKPSQSASRAGTPGFRAPEVLIKCPNQTTAIDIWSSGIIMLSLVSGVYPIMKPADDLTSLCQMTQLLGSRDMTSAAHVLGKKMICPPGMQGIDLRKFCLDLSQNKNGADNDNNNNNNIKNDSNITNNNNDKKTNNKDVLKKEELPDNHRKRSIQVVATPEKNLKNNKARFISPIKINSDLSTIPNQSTTTLNQSTPTTLNQSAPTTPNQSATTLNLSATTLNQSTPTTLNQSAPTTPNHSATTLNQSTTTLNLSIPTTLNQSASTTLNQSTTTPILLTTITTLSTPKSSTLFTTPTQSTTTTFSQSTPTTPTLPTTPILIPTTPTLATITPTLATTTCTLATITPTLATTTSTLATTTSTLATTTNTLATTLPDSAYDLLKGLLDPNPLTRLTASQALSSIFLSSRPSEL